MKDLLSFLFSRKGSYEGRGVNHDGQNFRGTLRLTPQTEGKGVSLDFCATGDDGTILHKEHSILGLTVDETLSLWVLSQNHPGVMEHRHVEDGTGIAAGAERTLTFRYGDEKNKSSFRETICLDFWNNGDVSYRYSWGMPGGDFKERSSVRLLAGKNRNINEAVLDRTEFGLVPKGEGWYVINAGEAEWGKHDKFGEYCAFEGDRRFEQYGVNIHVIHPGQPNCHYHGEDDQENFLVLSGQCKLLVEGKERLLKEWDFVHCPVWTRHVFVGAGSGPCAILMMGGRTGHGVIYPVIDLAKKYNACPAGETDSPQESYAGLSKSSKIQASWPEPNSRD